jgi:hypothetical protein
LLEKVTALATDTAVVGVRVFGGVHLVGLGDFRENTFQYAVVYQSSAVILSDERIRKCFGWVEAVRM